MLKRSELPDEVFGIPEERKYPMPDKRHTLSAIKLFGHVEDKYEKELAKNIIKNMKKFNISNDAVGDSNRLKKYLKEETEYENTAEFILDENTFKIDESGMAGVAPVIASPKPTEPTYIVNYMQNNVFTGSHQERFGICQSGMKNLHTFGGKYNRNHYTHLDEFEKEANHIKVYKYIGDCKNNISDIIKDAQTDMDYYRLLTGKSIDSRSDIEKDTDFVEEEYINDELSAIQECLYATAMADNINGSYLNSINESVEESRHTSILSSSYIIPMVNINEDGRIYNYYRDIDGVFVKNEVTGLRSKSYNDENDIRECVINLVKKGIVY